MPPSQKATPFKRRDIAKAFFDLDISSSESSTTSKATSYVYEPLKGRRDFRLLSICKERSELGSISCTLNTFTVGGDDCPQYKALSYTWGSPIYAKKDDPILSASIMCNGQTFSIGLNLMDALEEIGNFGYQGYIWIDAICINQQDVDERHSQVILMGEIYASASEVIVWLGKDTAFLSDVEWLQSRTTLRAEAWELVNQLKFTEAQALLVPINKTDEASREVLAKWKGYLRFFECRTWFTRAWIVQEVALARNIVVWCGSSKLSWSDIYKLVQLLIVSKTLNLIYRWSDITRGEGTPFQVFQLGRYRELCKQGLPKEDFDNDWYDGRQRSEHELRALRYYRFAYNLSGMVRPCLATDHRDKVFSFIGILERVRPNGIAPIIQPSYSLSTEQIYTSFTFALIQSLPSLVIISSVEERENRTLLNLPSWVPDFTCRSATSLSILTSRCKYRPVGHLTHFHEPRLTSSTLILHGYPVDVITATSLASCTGKTAVFEWENPSWFEYLESILTLADPAVLSTHYRSPAPAILCRTLIANAVDFGPAADSIDTSFYNWLANMIASPASIADTSAPGSSPLAFAKVLRALIQLIGVTYPRVGPVWEQLPVEIAQLATSLCDADDSALGLINLRMSEKSAAFNSAYSQASAWRKLFRTSRGLLGLGMRSVKVGDVVWAIENAQMVIVLRPSQSEVGNGLMEFIGDAYLHGCMQGEMIQSLGVSRKSREVKIK